MSQQVDQASERERNRANFPQAAAWLDELRAKFGEGCKLTWACENGREIGRRVGGDHAR